MAVPHPARDLSLQSYADLFHAAPVALLVMRADDLVMVDANAEYLHAVGRPADEIVGHHVFDVFPNSPLNTEGDQATDLRELFARTIDTAAPVLVEGMRYDIEVAGGFEARWWNVTETPVLDDAGTVTHLLHTTEDVTELRRTQALLEAAREAQDSAALQVSTLAEVALALTSAESVEDLERIVVARGLAVLGADGGAIACRDEPDGWRVIASDSLGEVVQTIYGRLPLDSPLPALHAARSGESVLLPTRMSGLAFDRSMADVYTSTGRDAWACLPLISQDRRLGSLSVSWVEEHHISDPELALMEGLAAQCATALDRIEQADSQRRHAEQVRTLAEALQSSMLTPPPESVDFDLAVRYRTANDVARVGGDWYDAFVQPDGDTMLVIGDVTGHDDTAAAQMGQLRSLLRALAYDGAAGGHHDDASPAGVLTRLEQTARGLDVDQISTAVVARVAAEPEPDGSRLVWWSNAGNPPPVLLEADGTTRLLDDEQPDLLLGIDPATRRTDHRTTLPSGSTLLLYTDGLIERRETSIDTGLADLRAALADLSTTPVQELCDLVLARLDPHTGEDDIAMVAVRV